MNYDIQRASMLKRIPAWVLDMILLLVVMTGFLVLWSRVFPVTPHVEEIDGIIAQYEQQYGGHWNIPAEEYEKMTDAEKEAAEKISLEISNALNQDEAALALLETVAINIFAMLSLSVLCAYVILEFVIPLLLKNGQTLGKKCFGVALMRKDGVKVTPFMMFARTVLGKCTVETMIPLLSAVMLFVGIGGPLFFLGVAVLLAQLIVPLATRNKTGIHDIMACTVAVDLSSQMIFDSLEAMEAYHAEIYADKTSDEA
ncbi:MAG: RDD family protein [Ruminococcaceae bacterium]|nr:RDD family protein [Oscillospiraceae bacterium]